MKEKKIISLTKNGKEVKKELNFFTRKELVNNIFEQPIYQGEAKEIYKIKKGIEIVLLKNITFKKNTQFILNKNTILILENCSFQTGIISFANGGSVELINPKLNPSKYTNRINISSLEDFSMIVTENNNCYVTINGTCKNFSINMENKIERINIIADKIYLKNIKEIKEIIIYLSKLTILDNCNISINSNNKIKEIEIKNIVLKNTTISSSYNTENQSLEETESITLINSNINLHGQEKNTIEATKIIQLENSTIKSKNDMQLITPLLKMDHTSKLISETSITLGSDTYTKKKEAPVIEINSKNYKRISEKRHLVSILKKLKENQENMKKRENNYKIRCKRR